MIQVLLVEGGALSGSICNGDCVLWVAFAVLILGRLGAVVVLVGVESRGLAVVAVAVEVIGVMFRAVVGGAPVFVLTVHFLGVLHVGMFVAFTIISKTVLGLLLNILRQSSMLCSPWWK
jgi:hypothetical protein